MKSITKVNANGGNAQQTSGPKSPTGKRNSSRNSLKEGLFARELTISEAEKPDFAALYGRLHADLQPRTTLQQIGFSAIVTCSWRCRLATRWEMRHLHLLEGSDEPSSSDGPAGNAVKAAWYASGRQALNDGIRFLRKVAEEFRECGNIREHWKEDLDRCFGPDFYRLLTHWAPPMKYAAVKMVESLVEKSELYKMPMLDVKGDESVRIVVDPEQAHQMTDKLIEQQLQHLVDLANSLDERRLASAAAQNPGTVDFAPRYFTTAMRDLQRAVQWFAHLKKHRL